MALLSRQYCQAQHDLDLLVSALKVRLVLFLIVSNASFCYLKDAD